MSGGGPAVAGYGRLDAQALKGIQLHSGTGDPTKRYHQYFVVKDYIGQSAALGGGMRRPSADTMMAEF